MDERQADNFNCEVEIALLKQRIELMERDVRDLDGDIRSLRSAIKHSFGKVVEQRSNGCTHCSTRPM
jgi:hypothetical protein